MMEYKGYRGVFEYDDSIGWFHGHVVGIRDLITFMGRSVEELRHEMGESVEDYLEWCGELGQEPEKPYRGEFLVRTTPDVHRDAATRAEAEGMSLNAWTEQVIKEATEQRPGRTRVKARKAPTPPRSAPAAGSA